MSSFIILKCCKKHQQMTSMGLFEDGHISLLTLILFVIPCFLFLDQILKVDFKPLPVVGLTTTESSVGKKYGIKVKSVFF